MRVWKVVADSDRYRGLLPKDGAAAADLFQTFDGRSLARRWRPLEVRLDRGGRTGDFPSLASHVPVFGSKARAALEPLLRTAVEFLPLACGDGEYYAANVRSVVAALDLSRSSVTRFDDGDILSIDRYAFRTDRLRDHTLFKLPEEPLRRPFATDAFKEAVERHGLRGLDFEPVGLT